MIKTSYYAIKTIGISITSLLIVVCIFFGYIVFCNITNMDVPTLGPFKMYMVLTDSMVPAFRSDDAIIVRTIDIDRLKKDDIITFYSLENDVVMSHRVLDVINVGDEIGFRTQGDANNSPDPFTTTGGRIIGKYMFRIPGMGRHLATATQRLYIIPLLVVLVISIQFGLSQAEKKLKEKMKLEQREINKNRVKPGKDNRDNEVKQTSKKTSPV